MPVKGGLRGQITLDPCVNCNRSNLRETVGEMQLGSEKWRLYTDSKIAYTAGAWKCTHYTVTLINSLREVKGGYLPHVIRAPCAVRWAAAAAAVGAHNTGGETHECHKSARILCVVRYENKQAMQTNIIPRSSEKWRNVCFKSLKIIAV